MKYCNKCNTSKPLSEFHPNKTKKNGYQSWCKKCVVASNGERQKRLLAEKRKKREAAKQALIDAGVKKCSNCKQLLPFEYFYKGNSNCKECKKHTDKQYQEYKQSKKVAKIIPVKEDAVFPDAMAKRCGKCLEIKTFKHFYKSSSSQDGYQSYCVKCNKDTDAERKKMLAIAQRLGKGHKVPKSQSHYNTVDYFENLRGEGNRAGRPSNDLFELSTARIGFLNKMREEWREVFNERYRDCINLLKDYEKNPDESVQLVTDFHNNVRPTWKLKHKTLKQLKESYYDYLRSMEESSRRDDSGPSESRSNAS